MNKPPTQPIVWGDYNAYAGEDIYISALATDPEGKQIRYIFEWDASKDGSTHIYTSDYVTSGANATDSFHYSNRDMGYVYHVTVHANDGYADGPSTIYSFALLPSSIADILNQFTTNAPFPDIPPTYTGTEAGGPNNVGWSAFADMSVGGLGLPYVIVIVAFIFVVLSIVGYRIYTGKYPFGTQTRKLSYGFWNEISNALPKNKFTEKQYNYSIKYKTKALPYSPGPTSKTNYERRPITKHKGRVKW